MAQRTYGQYCAVAQALDRVGDRWTLLIVRELLSGAARFGDLHTALPGIATNLLTQRLRDLERDGLVRREPLPGPRRVSSYELTDVGRSLEPAVLALGAWGMRWLLDAPYAEPANPRGFALALRGLLAGAADGEELAVNIEVGEDVLGVRTGRGVVTTALEPLARPGATMSMCYPTLAALVAGQLDLEAAVAEGSMRISGERAVVHRLEAAIRGAHRQLQASAAVS